ncbi:MAG: alginate lyase family protein [Fidelibacterota bacterium]
MSPRFLMLSVWIFWGFSAALNAQPDADEVFQHLNLDYPGLEQVKAAVEINDLNKARRELLHYFQFRTNRHLDGIEFPADRAQADQNAANVFNIRNFSNDFGSEIDWTWQGPDIEWHRSLNRLSWLLNFAGLYLQTRNEKYAEAWMEHVSSWIASRESGYPRTIDTGRRLGNWVLSYEIFVHQSRSPSVTPEFNAIMLESMQLQAEFLYQPENWRRYSNWGSFENWGISLFALMFPEFKRSQLWLKEVWFRMRFQLGESYHADGMHKEVSPSYHSHELAAWFDFVRLAKYNQVESPLRSQLPLPPLSELFLRPAKALMYLYKPTGVLPQVGDSDERDEREFLLKLGKFWKWPDLVYVATDGKEGIRPDKTSVSFPRGGYYIMRTGWGQKGLPFNEELYLLFDCGTNEPWHAHYDMLNIVVTAYGYDLLKDPGRFTYTKGEDRDYFKSTAAHNTVVIDGLDQPRRYTPPEAEWHSLSGFDYVVGTQSSHPQITSRRSVFFAKPEYWIVVDRLEGRGSHRYDQYWHLSEEVLKRVKIKSGEQRMDAPHLLLFSPLPGVEMNLEEGWIARRYRQKKKAPVVRCSLQRKPPVVWPTVLYPFKSQVPELMVNLLDEDMAPDNTDSSGAVALLISSARGTDFFFEQLKAGKPYKIRELETDAKLVFIRSDAQEGILGYRMVGGTYLTYRGKKLVYIIGKGSDISVQSDRVEIEGEVIMSFQLGVQNTPDVFLNGRKIEVGRKEGEVSFSRGLEK